MFFPGHSCPLPPPRSPFVSPFPYRLHSLLFVLTDDFSFFLVVGVFSPRSVFFFFFTSQFPSFDTTATGILFFSEQHFFLWPFFLPVPQLPPLLLFKTELRTDLRCSSFSLPRRAALLLLFGIPGLVQGHFFPSANPFFCLSRGDLPKLFLEGPFPKPVSLLDFSYNIAVL